MKLSRQSLRRRLLFRLWVPLLALMFAGAILSVSLARHFSNVVFDQWLFDSAMTLATQVKGNGTEATLNMSEASIQMLEWDRIDRVFYQVATERQGRIFGNAPLPDPPDTVSDQPTYYDAVLDQAPVRLVRVKVGIPGSGGDAATIILAETMAKRTAVVRSIMAAVVPLQVVLLVLAGVGIWTAVTSTLRGVDSLASEIAQVRPENLRPLENADALPAEVQPLVRSLNELIARLAEARETQQRFVANAAHQLRTPLAALQMQTQRALREGDPQRLEEALKAVERGIERLAHLTRQLLTLARAEPSTAAVELRDIDLAKVARAETENWVDSAVARGVDLGFEEPGNPVHIPGDEQLLAALIGNLVDNAIRYGKPSGRVTVSVSRAPLTLRVEDDGPGIPAGERKLVLERFYRMATTTESGSGLGLAIAQEIAARHGAKLEIASPANGVGTVVAVNFAA